jgi:hypothetical protein
MIYFLTSFLVEPDALMKTRLVFAATLLLTISGCAIQQTINPVPRFEGKEVCIVENLAVTQKGFLETYRQVLSEKGYAVKLLPAAATVTECPVTSTYTANWRWDLALYMAYANIQVYNNGQLAGSATYDSTRGGANMNKFIKGEVKITELVNQLFPRNAGS